MSSLTRTRRIAIVSVAVAVSLGFAPHRAGVERADATTLAGDCTPASDWGTVRPDLADQALQLVNAHRTAMGLRALVVSPTLSASAVWKARHMAAYNYLAHNDPAPPVGRTAAERLQACGYSAGWGEIIAAGFASAEDVFNAWLASPGHRAKIEDPSYAAIGSGAASSASGVFWAQNFGVVSDGVSPPPPPPPPPSPPQPPSPSPSPSPSPPPPPSPPSPPPGTTAASPGLPAPSASNGLSLRGLKLVPRHPRAGQVLTSKVTAMKSGKRLRTGDVFCSARFQGKPLQVVTARRLRRGTAVCAWRIPLAARGSIVTATVVVQQGRVRAAAPFRAIVS